jgi:hypothetical protein
MILSVSATFRTVGPHAPLRAKNIVCSPWYSRLEEIFRLGFANIRLGFANKTLQTYKQSVYRYVNKAFTINYVKRLLICQ